MKMKAICSSETLVDFQWNTWCHTPQDITLHKHHYENLKSCSYIANKDAEKLPTFEFGYLNKDEVILSLRITPR
jgi:hypothetical protein